MDLTGTKALCSSDMISSRKTLNLLTLTFEQSLLIILHSDMGRITSDLVGFLPWGSG
uniref:Uncharacterized protein n=1 Tax=Arundo donax TaxID=35708 RepID=A0A0A9GH09_ARUDO